MFTVQILYTLDNEQGSYTQFSKNLIAIFCHGHRVNRLKERPENRSVHGVTIVVQTFCGLKNHI